MYKVISGLFLVGLAVVFGLYFFTGSGNKSSSNHLSFEAPEQVVVGAPFDLVINVNNDMASLWEDARLSLKLPAGLVFFDASAEKSFEMKNLGRLGSGSLTKVIFKLIKVVTENEDSSLGAEAALSFNVEGIGSRFEEKKDWLVVGSQSAIDLKIEAPEKITSGEKFNIKINYKNVAGQDLDNLYLKFNYPEGFSYEKASVDLDKDEGAWDLGSLRNNSEGSLTVTGKLISSTSSTLNFSIDIFRKIGDNKHLIVKKDFAIATTESPLSVNVDLNEDPEYVARSGDTLNYAIGYNLSSGITGSDKVVIKVKLTGSVFDLATINVGDGGLIQSGSNQIVWNLNGRDLEGGSITFSVKVKSDYGIKRLGDRNFILKVEAEATSGKYASKAELQTKVAGKVAVATKGYFRDLEASVLNKGPMPPRVGQATNFTIHWQITNYANDVKNVEVRAPLMPGVLFSNFVSSSIDTKPTLDTATNEMVWQINRISATTGIANKPLEAIFQVQATPAAQNLNQYMPLLAKTRIKAKDDFALLNLEATAPEITTALPDDSTVGTSGIVVP